MEDSSCLLCNGGGQSSFHMFMECDLVNHVWFRSCWGLCIGDLGLMNLHNWVTFMLGDACSAELIGDRLVDVSMIYDVFLCLYLPSFWFI